MNLGLVTSFIIAALLMLSILSMNLRMSQSTQDISLHSMSQNHVSAISDLIQYDFPKIGYDASGPISNPITVAKEDEIQFEADLDNSGTIETVIWRLESGSLAGSNNADHRSLVRIEDGNTQEIKVGVTRFEIRYYSFDSSAPFSTPVTGTNLENINRIEVILEVQPREGTGRNNQFTTSSWHRVFTPPNINL
jgi:hypothetical protein